MDELRQAALRAREHAYAPYSGFGVGAALLTQTGQIFTGCNVENSAYSAGICAERTALVSAVAAGERAFQALYVVADTPGPCSPCGVCRQVLSEFAPDMPVYMGNLKGELEVLTVSQLLPRAFSPRDLEK